MLILHRVSRRLLALLVVALAGAAHGFDNEKIDEQFFVTQATANGIAEIETARLALEKGTSTKVKEFAQTMIDDHSAANRQIQELAASKQLDIAEEAELVSQAKALILKLRGDASFDKAYANNQVVAHRETLELFRKAARSTDADVSGFATQTLPRLEHHLQQAEELAALLGADED